MKISKFFTIVISFLMLFSFINFVNAGGEDMNFKLKIPSKTGHGFDKNRVEEFGWEWKEDKKTYINEHTKAEWDWLGFSVFGIHKNGTRFYSSGGCDWDGYHKNGVYSINMGKSCFGKKGYNHRGFNKDGKHMNGTRYDKKGLDLRRFNKRGIHAHTKTKYDSKDPLHGYDVNGRNLFGDTSEELAEIQSGAMSI